MFVVYARSGYGFYLAMAPAHLSPEQMESALNEPGVESEAVPEVGG